MSGIISLLPADIERLDAEDKGVDALCRLLNVAQPSEWPPLHNDADTRSYFRNGLQTHPGSEAWWCYYVIAHLPEGETLVGTAGYTGPPKHGEVEIGYSILAEYQRRGFASDAVKQLIDRAFTAGVDTVVAHTLPDYKASQGVMTKNAMRFAGETHDHEETLVWRFEVRR